MAKTTRSKRARPKAKRRSTTPAKAGVRSTGSAKPLSPATLGRLRRQLLALAPTDPDTLTDQQLATLRGMLLDRVPQDPPAS